MMEIFSFAVSCCVNVDENIWKHTMGFGLQQYMKTSSRPWRIWIFLTIANACVAHNLGKHSRTSHIKCVAKTCQKYLNHFRFKPSFNSSTSFIRARFSFASSSESLLTNSSACSSVCVPRFVHVIFCAWLSSIGVIWSLPSLHSTLCAWCCPWSVGGCSCASPSSIRSSWYCTTTPVTGLTNSTFIFVSRRRNLDLLRRFPWLLCW